MGGTPKGTLGGEPKKEAGMDQLAKERLAKLLSGAMAERNHTSAAQAARAMRISGATVGKWLDGFYKKGPDPEHWPIIADYAGVPVYVVLEVVGFLNREQVELLATIPGSIQIAEQMALAWVGYLNPEPPKVLARAG